MPRTSATPNGNPALCWSRSFDVRAREADRAMGEVEDAGAAVDEDEALRGERVERTEAEAEQRKADDFFHRRASPV